MLCVPVESEHCRSNSLRAPPPPKSTRTPQEEPHFVALSAGATSPGNGALKRSVSAVYFHHAVANRSSGHTPPRGNPGLKRTRMYRYAILKKFDKKINFNFKKNVQWDPTNFRSIK
jgi:hypothetical protein